MEVGTAMEEGMAMDETKEAKKIKKTILYVSLDAQKRYDGTPTVKQAPFENGENK